MKAHTKSFWRWAVVALVAALAFPAAAQAQLTTVSGTVHDYALQVLANHPYTITEVRRGGYIIPISDMIDYTDSLGVLTFQVPRSNFTTLDTTKVHFVLDAPQYWNNGRGVWLIIPDAATADLSTLPPAAYLGPPGFAVVIPPSGGGYGDSLHVADSLARLANTRVLAPLHVDSIRIADSIARVARDSAIASLDSARTIRNRLEARISELQTQLDTAGATTRAAIEGDIAKLRDSLVVHRGRIDLLEAAVEGKQAQLSVAQLARIDSALAAGLRVIITSYGDVREISFDTTGLMLGDMLNGANQAIAARLGIADSVTTYVTAWQHKLVTDTLDSWRSKIWAPAGGSNWTVDAGGVYRDSPVTIGQAAVDKRAALFVDGNVLVPDSSVKAKQVQTSTLVIDTTNFYASDSARIFIIGEQKPIWGEGEGQFIGWVEFEFLWARNIGIAASTPFDFDIYSDSTNGYQLSGIEYSIRSHDGGGAYGTTRVGGLGHTSTTISGGSTCYGPSIAIADLRGVDKYYSPAGANTRYKYGITAFSTANNVKWSLFKIKVWYRSTGTASTAPVRIINL